MTDRWPDFFITGPGRSATTSLYHYLAQHSEVYLPDEKEPRFFDKTLPKVADDPEALQRAEEAYLDRFGDAKPHQRIGEGSVAYVYHRDALRRIRAKRPDAQFIVSYRDPVERAYSLYWLVVAAGREELGFREALERGLEDHRAGLETPRAKYLRNGRQGTQLQRLHDVFDEDQVLVLLFEELVDDVSTALVDVAEFLDIDVDEARRIEPEKAHNTFQGVPPNRLAHWIRSSDWIKRAARAVLPKRVRDFLGNDLLLVEREKPPMDPEARALLVDFFEPEVQQVETLLGRELPELRRSWPDAEGAQSDEVEVDP